MLGSTCRNRALLEFERPFMRNTSDVTFQDPGEIEINDRQLISMLLDLQKLNYLGQADIYRKAIKIFLKEYVRFSVQFYKYECAVKKEQLSNAEENEDDDHVATLIINTNAYNTASTHLQNSPDCLADGSSNLLEQECEETLQADDADNAKISFKRRIKWWCGYVVNWKEIYPNKELLDR